MYRSLNMNELLLSDDSVLSKDWHSHLAREIISIFNQSFLISHVWGFRSIWTKQKEMKMDVTVLLLLLLFYLRLNTTPNTHTRMLKIQNDFFEY